MCFVDGLVNSMKTPLLWLWRTCKSGRRVSTAFSDTFYQAAWDFSVLGDTYSPFESAYIYAEAGEIQLKLVGDTVTPQVSFSVGSEYEAYDRLIGEKEAEPQKFTDEAKTWCNELWQTVTLSGNRFDYQLNPAVVAQGVDALSPILDRQFKLPATWQFPRYTLGDFRTVISILRVVAMAHYLARVAAARRGCEGLGIVDSVRVMTDQELIKRLCRYSNLTAPVVRSIVRDLTFGERGMRNPDPALQPLIPLTKDRIAISPALFLGLDVERNFTVLLNRIPEEKGAYSRLTNDREEISRNEMKRMLASQPVRFWHGTLPGRSNDLPDIDLAIINDTERVCLILELKAFIQPAEPREILEKNKEIKKGVTQSLSLREAYLQTPELFSSCLPIDDQFEFTFAVASESFIGTHSVQDELVPVIRSFHLVRHLIESGSLIETCDWLQSRQYLPVCGQDYEVKETESTVGSWKVNWYGIKPLQSDAASPDARNAEYETAPPHCPAARE